MTTLTSIVSIYRAIKDKARADGSLEGNLEVQDAAMRSFLLSTTDDATSADIGLTILSDPEQVQVGAVVRIRLFQPRDLPVYRNLSALLGNGSRLLEPISDFYIVDKDWSSDDPKPPTDAVNLSALERVMKQLSESASVVDNQKQRLLFADNAGLVDLPINVSPSDLRSITPDSAEMFVEFCNDTLHRQHRLEAVADVVIRLTRGMSANDRLRFVLRSLDKVLFDAKSQHAVFLSAFSYEKVRDEIESLKVEYTAKIHKVLSDIQGQLLGIPAATVIVATQMKTATQVGSEFIANSAILLGAWIFGIFLILLLRNQFLTLEVIKTEVDRQKRQLSAELPDVAGKFYDVFSILYRRIRHQNRILRTVDVVVILGLLLSCFAFWVFSYSAIKMLL